jgi:large subunit ribosomal protein L24
MRIKTGDLVEVTVGKDAAASEGHRVRGRVLSIETKTGRITVEGVARVYKHVRPSQKHPQGGRIHIERPVHMSNVMPVCPKCDKGVRVGVKINEDGSRDRVCRKCGASLGKIRTAAKKK